VGEGAEFGFIVSGSIFFVAIILVVGKIKKIAIRKIAIEGLEIFEISKSSNKFTGPVV
jgi:hypothetical protein